MDDHHTLRRLQQFVDEMKSTNSSLKKGTIMMSFPDLKPLFKIFWNPNLKYHVSPASLQSRHQKNIADKQSYMGKQYVTLLDLLIFLTDTETTSSNATRDTVLNYINTNSDFKDLIYLILNKGKKLKIRMGEKSVQKIFPDLFASFSVSLGSIEKNPKEYVCNSINAKKNKSTWFISRKYDGVRTIVTCIGTFKNLKVCAYSRQGNSVTTIQKILDYVIQYIVPAYVKLGHEYNEKNKDNEDDEYKADPDTEINFVLDGEIVVFDKNGKEDFTMAVSQYRRKNKQMDNPHYKLFDLLTGNEFVSKESNAFRTFSVRTLWLKMLLQIANEDIDIAEHKITIVEQHKFTLACFKEMEKQFLIKGWEGLILRKNVPYKGRRTRDILKVKREDSIELVVIRIIKGTQPTMSDTGIMEDESVLAAVVVKHKGIEVNVGTGFSLNDKRLYYTKPELIMGKTIRIDFMEETDDHSLRHPVFKGIVGGAYRDI